MLPTPSTSHVSFDTVYEPAEDSYLLLDTLSSAAEVSFLQSRFSRCYETTKSNDKQYDGPSPLVVEIGTGSGLVLAFLNANAKYIFGREDVLTLGTDVNSFACAATAKTVKMAIIDTNIDHCLHSTEGAENGLFTGCVLADLAAPIRSGTVDVLIFNPPYVPTPDVPSISEGILPSSGVAKGCGSSSFALDSHLLSLSYAGGLDGMETTYRLFNQLSNVLHKDRGVAYILLCAQNQPEVVKACVRDWGPEWAVESISSSGKKGGWEKLQVIRIWRIGTCRPQR